MNKYGVCSRCGTPLEAIWFIEEETETVGGSFIKTGRKRKAVSHLECSYCGKRECVDDSFDGRWH